MSEQLGEQLLQLRKDATTRQQAAVEANRPIGRPNNISEGSSADKPAAKQPDRHQQSARPPYQNKLKAAQLAFPSPDGSDGSEKLVSSVLWYHA